MKRSRYRMMMRKAETDIIGFALKAAHNSVADAAQLLQIDKSRLYRRMRALDIPTPTGRTGPKSDPTVDTAETPSEETVDQSEHDDAPGVDESAN